MGSGNENKRRREERIRMLLDRSRQTFGRAPSGPPAEPRGIGSAEPHKYAAEPDPEIEWKRKSKEWLREINGADSLGTSQTSHDRSPLDRMPSGSRMLTGLLRRFALSALVFGAVWVLFRLDMPGAGPARAFVVAALTEEMDTAAVATWYRDAFAGAPSFIPSFGTEGTESRRADGTVRIPIVAPVQGGSIVRSFAETLNGVEIYGAAGTAVAAMETGRVSGVFIEGPGAVRVVIRHADKVESVYGKLAEAAVQ
ncbi:M23 family metallopeptidase, partial [Paenibacillus darwinianus]